MNWGGCGRNDRPQSGWSVFLLNRILFYYKWFNYETGKILILKFLHFFYDGKGSRYPKWR
jgi:hypothetical protein